MLQELKIEDELKKITFEKQICFNIGDFYNFLELKVNNKSPPLRFGI